MKFGNLNFLEPSGPLQACNGTALPGIIIIIIIITVIIIIITIIITVADFVSVVVVVAAAAAAAVVVVVVVVVVIISVMSLSLLLTFNVQWLIYVSTILTLKNIGVHFAHRMYFCDSVDVRTSCDCFPIRH